MWPPRRARVGVDYSRDGSCGSGLDGAGSLPLGVGGCPWVLVGEGASLCPYQCLSPLSSQVKSKWLFLCSLVPAQGPARNQSLELQPNKIRQSLDKSSTYVIPPHLPLCSSLRRKHFVPGEGGKWKTSLRSNGGDEDRTGQRAAAREGTRERERARVAARNQEREVRALGCRSVYPPVLLGETALPLLRTNPLQRRGRFARVAPDIAEQAGRRRSAPTEKAGKGRAAPPQKNEVAGVVFSLFGGASTAAATMSTLAAARADNMYYPPEWRPEYGGISKFQGSKGHNQYEKYGKIRFELPVHGWCLGCGRHIGRVS